jgi:FkbM family methyltransferase
MITHKAKTKLENFHPLNSVLELGINHLVRKYPLKTAYYYLFKKLFYQRTQQGKIIRTNTFFGDRMYIMLPASLDIFFFGLKSHASEIALSRYIVNNLREGDAFLDIGAHFGYYTLLAEKITGPSGKVISVEASPETFKVLRLNTNGISNIQASNLALSESQNGTVTFCVFPVYYSELNTLNPLQYSSSSWFGQVKSKMVEVATTTISSILDQHNVHPRIIKIDVEGAEDRVLKGAEKKLLELEGTSVIVEYINDGKDQSPYVSSEQLLRSIHYTPYYIRLDGSLQPCGDSVKEFMDEKNLQSENIVFLKSN